MSREEQERQFAIVQISITTPLSQGLSRLDAEWVALNAVRELAKIASRGNIEKSTYENALRFGSVLYPELLGDEQRLLGQQQESQTTKEYKQRATLQSIQGGTPVTPLKLVQSELAEIETLLKAQKADDKEIYTYQLKKRLESLKVAEEELDIRPHSEHQLIFRDVYNVKREVPSPQTGFGFKDFQLDDNKILRIRVLHPDKPEHITGADIIYEKHNVGIDKVTVAAVQYKIWEKKQLSLSDKRMMGQLEKLRKFICENDLCKPLTGDSSYRFPCCAAFIRPTDRLQNPNQRFLSTGEHLPICLIAECATEGPLGAKIIEYERIKGTSLSGDLFENLLNYEKIGSRPIDRTELNKLYEGFLTSSALDRVVIYAQEFADDV